MTRLAVGLLIGAMAFWWAAHGLDTATILQAMAAVSPAWVLASLSCVVAVALSKAARWRALYEPARRRASFWELFFVLVAAQMVNLVVPVRTGELIRIEFMKQAGQHRGVTLSTIVVEKALDLFALALLSASLVALAMAPVWLRQPASSLFLISLILLVSLMVVWGLRDGLQQSIARILRSARVLPERWRSQLRWLLQTTLEALGSLTDLLSLAHLLFWTAVIWLISFVTILTLFAAFGLHLPVAAAAVLMVTLSFSYVVPTPPALAGVMPGIAVLVLSQYGVARSTALGFGIVLNVVLVTPLLVLGGWAVWSRTVSVLGLLHKRPVDEPSPKG